MQPTNISKQEFIRNALEIARKRMSSNFVNTTNVTTTADVKSKLLQYPSISSSIMEVILGVAYILVIIVFLMKLLLRTIQKFECYYMSPCYNRFGFITSTNEDSEDSESSSESNYTESESDSENDDDATSLSSPISSRVTLSGKCLHLATPFQRMNTLTPKTPLPPLRRSLRLKIKSELNLSQMENKNVVTQSEIKQNQTTTTMGISSDPCPRNFYRSSITNPSPHPEHDEERAFYIQYCNEKKIRKNKRPEFNSPLFIRRLML